MDVGAKSKRADCATPITADLRSTVIRKSAGKSDDGGLSEKCPILTVPNETRCAFTTEVHELPIESCCPVSYNPQPGSFIAITYEPADKILEVASLRRYVDSYRGGRGSVRSMEGMIQACLLYTSPSPRD